MRFILTFLDNQLFCSRNIKKIVRNNSLKLYSNVYKVDELRVIAASSLILEKRPID